MKVLLIDDDIELASMLSEYIHSQGFDVECAHDGEQGLALALENRHDLILLDVMLPILDGFEVLKQLRTTSLVPVIMLTAKGDDFDRIFGLELGADDYIPKPFNHRELIARIKAITRRIEHINHSQPRQELEFANLSICMQSRSASAQGQTLTLTGTEFAILHLLLQEPGAVISKEQISEQVLGRRLAPYDRSIDMHVSNLRKKIAEHIENERIRTIRGAGYVLIGDA
ncbi:response regulator transcription factor [Pseudoalteromonas sp. BDTF-M6]|uniref:response regulator transcription factor n=1 Tax=Pseudoalteromonas sp. BDTF-M6 TaxID=2796132 RepID=UPI001BB08706|nr:response regulator transcription factor [Pseudoalteromonas sp. BDTF-M6]MBS3797436.1 response regulator transcription factor [Pseudoalteromonas sp. BDTF-M6]